MAIDNAAVVFEVTAIWMAMVESTSSSHFA